MRQDHHSTFIVLNGVPYLSVCTRNSVYGCCQVSVTSLTLRDVTVIWSRVLTWVLSLIIFRSTWWAVLRTIGEDVDGGSPWSYTHRRSETHCNHWTPPHRSVSWSQLTTPPRLYFERNNKRVKAMVHHTTVPLSSVANHVELDIQGSLELLSTKMESDFSCPPTETLTVPIDMYNLSPRDKDCIQMFGVTSFKQGLPSLQSCQSYRSPFSIRSVGLSPL